MLKAKVIPTTVRTLELCRDLQLWRRRVLNSFQEGGFGIKRWEPVRVAPCNDSFKVKHRVFEALSFFVRGVTRTKRRFLAWITGIFKKKLMALGFDIWLNPLPQPRPFWYHPVFCMLGLMGLLVVLCLAISSFTAWWVVFRWRLWYRLEKLKATRGGVSPWL
jgi:hypothetical protein